MKSNVINQLAAVAMLAALACAGCGDTRVEKAAATNPPKATPPPARSEPVSPPPPRPALNHPPTSMSAANVDDNNVLALTGITFKVPENWSVEPINPGPFSAKAAFRIQVEGSDEQCAVRITHYPTMKGKDEMNIDRWASQFSGPDGNALTRESGNVTKSDVADGKIRLTTVEFTGSMASGMSGSGPSQPDQQLVAAIVDHALGPHFVKVTGSVESMKSAKDSILAFLKSAGVK